MAENPSLTETICFAVSTAGDLPTLVGDCPKPWPQSVIDLLRGFLEALDRDLKASNSLVERAAEFRGHYATPPEPIAGHSAASYHELGRYLAMDMLHRVMEAANPSPGFILSPDPLTASDFDGVLNNLPRVERYLREEAPRFDWPLLVAKIHDEEAKAKRCASRDSSEIPLPNTGKRPRGKKADAEKKICYYVVDRQTYYDSLKPRCQQNDASALKQAEGMFGRNKLAGLLGLSAGMVSSTKAWKDIKADLFPASRADALSKIRHSGSKVAFDIAEEAAGQASGDQTVDAVVRNETLVLIRAANLPEAAAEQMVNQLQAGAMTDTDARDMLESYQDGETSRRADIEAEHQRPRQRRTRKSDR